MSTHASLVVYETYQGSNVLMRVFRHFDGHPEHFGKLIKNSVKDTTFGYSSFNDYEHFYIRDMSDFAARLILFIKDKTEYGNTYIISDPQEEEYHYELFSTRWSGEDPKIMLEVKMCGQTVFYGSLDTFEPKDF